MALARQAPGLVQREVALAAEAVSLGCGMVLGGEEGRGELRAVLSRMLDGGGAVDAGPAETAETRVPFKDWLHRPETRAWIARKEEERRMAGRVSLGPR